MLPSVCIAETSDSSIRVLPLNMYINLVLGAALVPCDHMAGSNALSVVAGMKIAEGDLLSKATDGAQNTLVACQKTASWPDFFFGSLAQSICDIQLLEACCGRAHRAWLGAADGCRKTSLTT